MYCSVVARVCHHSNHKFGKSSNLFGFSNGTGVTKVAGSAQSSWLKSTCIALTLILHHTCDSFCNACTCSTTQFMAGDEVCYDATSSKYHPAFAISSLQNCPSSSHQSPRTNVLYFELSENGNHPVLDPQHRSCLFAWL